VLRRAECRPQRGVLRYAGLTLDPVTRTVMLDGKPVHLSVKEFSLLQRLADEPERVYSKNDLLRDVWGYLSIGKTRTVDAHACRLRKKLEAASSRRWVVNVRGVGYRLTDPA
jgi:DNA-binding response OmpR family regulator